MKIKTRETSENETQEKVKLVNFHWKRSADLSKEVPAGEGLRACASFDHFICNIPVVICKLDLVFCF